MSGFTPRPAMDRCDCARGRDYMRFPKITPTWHPPSEAAGERNCNPLRSRALALPHQSARTALALVVGTAASRSCHRLAYARFAIEPLFRFFKQTLKWTVPKLRSPASADRWTWLLILLYLQLRLAQPLVQEHRLPWQAPVAVEQLTPARVRRAFACLLPTLGSPVTGPKPCGISPGRPKGTRSPPAQRFPALKLTP